jgi:Raf kinase inhibitor-like YbhB/YbcL family protein
MTYNIRTLAITLACFAIGGIANAQGDFMLTSPTINDGGDLPLDFKCTRDGGAALTPGLQWSDAPIGTESFAVIMHHYPQNTTEGVDDPSQYWLLWEIPATTTDLPAGNPNSVGHEGADKDRNITGYTPPCSPPGARHEYMITVFALDAVPELPKQDDISINWAEMSDAIDEHIIASSSISFWN